MSLSTSPLSAELDDDRRRPVAVEEISGLEYGKVTTDGRSAGAVTLDPRTARKSTRGGAVDLGGFHGAAQFRVTGEPNARFVITLPRRVELSADGSGIGRAVLSDFQSDPPRIGTLGPEGAAMIRVGATLRLPRASGTGQFRSDFAIFVDYED